MGTDRILLLANPVVAECLDAGKELEKKLAKSGFEVARDRESLHPASAKLILLLGGDGYLMEVIQDLQFPSTPFFGVNFGTVGFLMNPRQCLEKLPATLREDKFRAEEYPVLQCEIELRSGKRLTRFAFNDIVLERMSGQSIRFTALVDDVEFNRYSGDGVIIATPGGSTAYNLAAGGPVLHPGIAAMVITPLYPHRAMPFHSLQFSLALPLHRTLRIEGHGVAKRPIRVLADGRPTDDVASIIVRDSGRRIHLLRLQQHSFVRTLSRTFIGNETV